MKFHCNDIGLKLEIDDDLLHRLIEHGKSNYPNEFGGILAGFYSDDQKSVHIKETILPEEFETSMVSFKRGMNGIKKKLIKLYSQYPRIIYVGEWHTHPNGIPSPSRTDIKAMDEIINCKDVRILNPILLILGNLFNSFDYCFFVHFNNKLYKYEKYE